jgi:hypothetical protein
MSSLTMTAVPNEVESPVAESLVKELKQAEIIAPSDPQVSAPSATEAEISVRTVAITAAVLLAVALCVLALGAYLSNQRYKTSAPQSSPRSAVTSLSLQSC